MNIIKKDSPNFKYGRDGYTVNTLVLHITGDSNKGQAVNWLCDPQSGVSAHYVIEKSGDIFELVSPLNQAWHAGIVNKPTARVYLDKGTANPNRYSIGIECVSSGEVLETSQYIALLELVNYLCKTYNIPRTRYNIIGHYELDSVNRAFDPISSYSVDQIVKELSIMSYNPNLTPEEIVRKASTSGDAWVKALDTIKLAADANGSLGDVEMMKWIYALIKKVYDLDR